MIVAAKADGLGESVILIAPIGGLSESITFGFPLTFGRLEVDDGGGEKEVFAELSTLFPLLIDSLIPLSSMFLLFGSFHLPRNLSALMPAIVFATKAGDK
jgi:hypothetical protein